MLQFKVSLYLYKSILSYIYKYPYSYLYISSTKFTNKKYILKLKNVKINFGNFLMQK